MIGKTPHLLRAIAGMILAAFAAVLLLALRNRRSTIRRE